MTEVVVIGGGIAGAAVALELVERGVAVNVVDAERPGAAATGASAGMLAPQYESPGRSPLFDLLVQSRDHFPDFAARLEALSGHSLPVRWPGMLVANVSAEETEAARDAVRWQEEAGQPSEIVSPEEADGLQSGINQGVDSFVWLPREGLVDSQALAEVLPEALTATDVRLITGRQVVEIMRSAGRVSGVRLADGRSLDADVVVVAAGAWSDGIKGLPRSLPVKPVRGHLLRFPPGEAPLQRVLASHAGRYIVPRDDGSMLAGSTMDYVGFDRSLSEEGMKTVHRSATELLPALATAEAVERWADLRPISTDGLPVIGPDPEVKGLHYATGYGRNGILLAPLAGRVVAELITEGASPTDWRPFSADRL